MGGKSRKTGTPSWKLIQKIKRGGTGCSTVGPSKKKKKKVSNLLDTTNALHGLLDDFGEKE